MADIEKLRAEIVNDPLGRGYSSMTDAEVADSLNARDRQQPVPIPSVEVKRYLFTRQLWLPIKRGTDNAAETVRDGLEMFESFRVDESDVAATMDGMLDALISAGYITSSDKSAIQEMGVKMLTRAEEKDLLGRSPEIGFTHVEQARAL